MQASDFGPNAEHLNERHVFWQKQLVISFLRHYVTKALWAILRVGQILVQSSLIRTDCVAGLGEATEIWTRFSQSLRRKKRKKKQC